MRLYVNISRSSRVPCRSPAFWPIRRTMGPKLCNMARQIQFAMPQTRSQQQQRQQPQQAQSQLHLHTHTHTPAYTNTFQHRQSQQSSDTSKVVSKIPGEISLIYVEFPVQINCQVYRTRDSGLGLGHGHGTQCERIIDNASGIASGFQWHEKVNRGRGLRARQVCVKLCIQLTPFITNPLQMAVKVTLNLNVGILKVCKCIHFCMYMHINSNIIKINMITVFGMLQDFVHSRKRKH